jgi:nitroreductase
MEFDEVVRKRKMIREYEIDRPVPDYIIAKLIDNAHRAPSAGYPLSKVYHRKRSIDKIKIRRRSTRESQVYDAAELIIVCSNTSK